MIDRALNISPVQQESFHFQLIPLTLYMINKESELPAKGTTYRFTVFKADQKFDESKIPLEAKFNTNNGVPSLDIAPTRLNFYLPSFNKVRKHQFVLNLTQNQNNEDYDVGSYSISANSLIAEFKERGKIFHQLKATLSPDYELEFQIFIEKNRPALENNVKELHRDRVIKQTPKSKERTTTPKSRVSQQVIVQTPSRDVEPFKPESKPARKLNQPQSIRTEEEEPKQKETGQRSEKNEWVSQKSGGSKVPLIQTRYKAVTKINAPAEIKIAQSQRLSTIADSDLDLSKPKPTGGQPDIKQKAMLWIFLGISAIIMYLSMHPNSKV